MASDEAKSPDIPTRPYLEPDRNPISVYAEFEVRHWWFWGRRKILERLVPKLVEPQTGKIILDVGCGPGGNISCLAPDYRCFGIDPSAEAADTARLRHPSVTFYCGWAPDDILPVVSNADLILIMDVLEHIRDERSLLEALVREAKPGCQFLITVPSDPALWSSHDDTVGHLRRYTPAALRALWDGMPVEVRLFSPFMSHLFPFVKLQRAINRRAQRSSGAEGTDLQMPPRPLNDLLGRVFAHEGRALTKAVGSDGSGFRHGVSLIAVLTKTGILRPTRSVRE